MSFIPVFFRHGYLKQFEKIMILFLLLPSQKHFLLLRHSFGTSTTGLNKFFKISLSEIGLLHPKGVAQMLGNLTTHFEVSISPLMTMTHNCSHLLGS